jgi:hypothetical protein
LQRKVKREKQKEGKENALKKLAWGSLARIAFSREGYLVSQ